MLVLTRHEGETLVIGEPGQVLTEPIRVTLVRNGISPRIGIVAQRDLRILRSELAERKDEADAQNVA